MTTRHPIVAGNWKMNLTRDEAIRLTERVAMGCFKFTENTQVLLFPPFVYLDAVRSVPDTNHIGFGAQDVYCEPFGAFTGEICVEMLTDLNVSHALIGHSERRHVLGESDELIKRKLRRTIEGGLTGVLCVGETDEQREAGETNGVNDRQVTSALDGLKKEQADKLVVAYEPVWAIGTGKTATPNDAQEAHAFIRGRLSEIFDEDTAEKVRILYGGSVKPDNAEELFSMPDIDGGLVGGASLKAEDFLEIIKASSGIDAVTG